MAYSDDLDRMDRKPWVTPKPGDKVRIKSIHWYLRWKNSSEDVPVDKLFCGEMSIYCGTVMTVSSARTGYFYMNEDNSKWVWTMEMFEEVYPAVIEGASSISDYNGWFINSPQDGWGIPQKVDLSKRCLDLKTNLTADTLEQNMIDLFLSTFFQNIRDTELQTIKRHKFIKLKDL